VEACHNKKENLVLYAYGELDSNSAKEIETHLAICKSCRYEYKRLSALLGKIRETVKPPVLSPQQVKTLVTNIKWKLKEKQDAKWWRRYLELEPARMIPVVAAACILIITAGILGYVKINKTKGLQPYAGHQSEELILSDRDLEIVNNLEFLKEMDAIQKLSQVVDVNGEINPQGEIDTETRGMKQDAHHKYFV
jgi:hypothetical protein